MSLTIFHNRHPKNSAASLVRTALACAQTAPLLLDGLTATRPTRLQRRAGCFALPHAWQCHANDCAPVMQPYDATIPVNSLRPVKLGQRRWLTLINGQFAARLNESLLANLLNKANSDLIAVNADPTLEAYRERMQVTPDSQVAGFRRIYADTVLEDALPHEWPHFVFLSNTARKTLLIENTLPLAFCELLHRCTAHKLTLKCFRLAGQVLDLESETGLLRLMHFVMNSPGQRKTCLQRRPSDQHQHSSLSKATIAPSARLCGPVIVGPDVHIADNALLVGPVILARGVRVEADATLHHAIIGPHKTIPPHVAIRGRVLLGNGLATTASTSCNPGALTHNRRWEMSKEERLRERHKVWPVCSYPGGLKRGADVIASALALLVFAPVLPFLALAVKLSSRGPVFYKGKRQGRYGREFYCLKFRSMRTGADRLQQLLRARNEVDGPQFKMEDDPRVTRVGAFLRDTYLDELPQLFNVLVGQMSLVGPRPSPEEENTLCPWWRDARLSVRPGMTGLWQMCRTRELGQDFQEWIHYDAKYVRQLSWKMDLWICCQTAGKFAWRFLRKF